MLLNLNKLIDSEIFISHHILEKYFQSRVNSFVIFEEIAEDDGFTPCSLIFFPKNSGGKVTFEYLARLNALTCYGVFFEDDNEICKIRQWASQLKFPILELSSRITISQAIEQCYRLAYGEPLELASESLRIMNRLVNLIIASKGSSEGVIKSAMELLSCPVAYATADFLLQGVPTIPPECLFQIPFLQEKTVFEWEHALYGFDFSSSRNYPCLAIGLDDNKIGGYLFQNEYTKNLHLQTYIFPIRDASVNYGYLILATDDKFDILPVEKGIIIQQVQIILRLEISKSAEVAQAINRYYDFILDELIESENSDFEKLMRKYSLAQKTIYDTYYVILAGRSQPKISTSPFHELLTSQQFNLLYSKISDLFGNINFFIFERRDFIVLFIPGQFKAKQSLIDILEAHFRNLFKGNLDGIGISNTVSKKELRKAYYQAKKALTISSNFSDKRPFRYNELGVMEYFFDHEENIDFGPLLDVHEEYLKPVQIYDDQHGTDLLNTLSTYIKCCSSTSAICAELFIHKNTLYSRLNKISQILGKDLSDSDVIFHVTLALKVRMMLNAGLLESDQPPDLLQKQIAMLEENELSNNQN
ncbi:helix-turn-helix domain-containing protein [bacterium]|nr:helix-turn-helix domain-containing protein [bacterium]